MRGSNIPSAGTIEVFYYGVWGGILGLFIDIRVGHVICRQLGYSGAKQVFRGSVFGHVKGPLLIEQISCIGNESEISNCTTKAIGGRRSRWYFFFPEYRASVVCVEAQVELSKGGYSKEVNDVDDEL